MPFKQVTVSGSLDDLLDRVGNRSTFTPRRFSSAFLASGLQPETSYMGGTPRVLPATHEIRRAAGPNIVVAVSTGSVQDLALLWNLRAAHGDQRSLPIGVPVELLTEQALRALQQPGNVIPFGFGGGALHLTSTSVELTRLGEIARSVSSVRVVPHQDLLTFGPARGRPRSHVTTWHGGHTRLSPFSDSDREVLGAAGSIRHAQLVLDVRVMSAPLPADPTMRGTTFGRFQAGNAQIAVSTQRQQETVRVAWPSSWTSLEAVAATKQIRLKESQPGLAARALIQALGDVHQARLLAHGDLISLLYRMAEVSGMSWWKQRWVTTHRQLQELGVENQVLEEAADSLGRDVPVVAPPGEGRAVASKTSSMCSAADPQQSTGSPGRNDATSSSAGSTFDATPATHPSGSPWPPFHHQSSAQDAVERSSNLMVHGRSCSPTVSVSPCDASSKTTASVTSWPSGGSSNCSMTERWSAPTQASLNFELRYYEVVGEVARLCPICRRHPRPNRSEATRGRGWMTRTNAPWTRSRTYSARRGMFSSLPKQRVTARTCSHASAQFRPALDYSSPQTSSITTTSTGPWAATRSNGYQSTPSRTPPETRSSKRTSRTTISIANVTTSPKLYLTPHLGRCIPTANPRVVVPGKAQTRLSSARCRSSDGHNPTMPLTRRGLLSQGGAQCLTKVRATDDPAPYRPFPGSFAVARQKMVHVTGRSTGRHDLIEHASESR